MTTLSTPAREFGLVGDLADASASSGVNGDGLSTTAFPTATAGITFTRFRYSGKLNGVDRGDDPDRLLEDHSLTEPRGDPR